MSRILLAGILAILLSSCVGASHGGEGRPPKDSNIEQEATSLDDGSNRLSGEEIYEHDGIPRDRPADLESSPVCGNGRCEEGESEANCPADCGPSHEVVCGNGRCEEGETPQNCPADCGPSHEVVCGNGKCEEGETPQNCPADCVPPSPPPPPCQRYAECVYDCNHYHKGDTSCITECQSQVDPDAVKSYNDFTACYEEKCKDAANPLECIDKNCREQYIKCFSGTRYDTCIDLVFCLKYCPGDDPSTPNVNERQQCTSDCRGYSTYDAQRDLQRLDDCVKGLCKNECQDPNSVQCVQCSHDGVYDKQCREYAKKCLPNGDYTCGQILDCLMGCDQDEKKCVNDCSSKGTLEDQKQFSDWRQCGANACKNDCSDPKSRQCKDCWRKVLSDGGQCHDQYQACVEDIPSGNQHCKESWTCMAGATTNDEYLKCKYNATKDAQHQIEKIQWCVADNCKTQCQDPSAHECSDCIKSVLDLNDGACKDLINQCLSDSNPN